MEARDARLLLIISTTTLNVLIFLLSLSYLSLIFSLRQEMVATMENEITKEINIEHRFHRTMIGTKGEKIREIRDKYNQVSSEMISLGFSSIISS